MPPIRSLAMVTSLAFSLVNFRGPLIEALIASGVRVHALAPDHTDATRAALRAIGAEPVDMRMERTGMRILRDAVDWLRLVSQLRRIGPDATFCYFVKPVIYGSLAARRAGVRRRFAMVAGLGYVYTPGSREPLSLRRRLLRRTVSGLYRRAFAACHRIFFQNEDDVRELREAGLLRAGSPVVLLEGTGVDLDRFFPAPPVTEPVTFLLMARLLREKGIVEYVEAARIVRRTHPEARFLLLGGLDANPGALRREEIKRWVAEGAVEWRDHVDDVRPWIAQASVYVLPSYREGKPRSSQEAMAMARPLITTDVPGCRDTVREGVSGFLVPAHDAAAVAAAMRRFIEDRSLIAAMGAASRELAEERFDVHAINRTILREIGIGPPEPPPGPRPAEERAAAAGARLS